MRQASDEFTNKRKAADQKRRNANAERQQADLDTQREADELQHSGWHWRVRPLVEREEDRLAIAQRHPQVTRRSIQRHSDLDRGRMPCAPERRRKVDPGAAYPHQAVIERAFGHAPAR